MNDIRGKCNPVISPFHKRPSWYFDVTELRKKPTFNKRKIWSRASIVHIFCVDLWPPLCLFHAAAIATSRLTESIEKLIFINWPRQASKFTYRHKRNYQFQRATEKTRSWTSVRMKQLIVRSKCKKFSSLSAEKCERLNWQITNRPVCLYRTVRSVFLFWCFGYRSPCSIPKMYGQPSCYTKSSHSACNLIHPCTGIHDRKKKEEEDEEAPPKFMILSIQLMQLPYYLRWVNQTVKSNTVWIFG